MRPLVAAPPSTTPSTYEAGIDTARLLYRIRDDRLHDGLDAMCGAAPMKLGPLRAGFMRAYELLWVEGRPSTLYDAETTALLPAGALPDAEQDVARLVADHGIKSARQVGVSRLDVTASVSFSRPDEGWAVLRGLAGVDAPRRKTCIHQQHGKPETVAWVTERGKQRERAYDKGYQLKVGPAGQLVRLEAQVRYPTRERTTAEWFTMEAVRETFQGRFAPAAYATAGLHVASENTMRQQVREMVEAGSMTGRQAELLLGHLAAESVGIPRPGRTVRRRRAELRRLGLALALDGAGEVDVDLGAVLADVMTTPRWES